MTALDIVALTVAIVFGVIAAWHYYWALGGAAGMGYAIPQRRDGAPLFQPGRGATFGIAAVFSFVVVLVLANAGWIHAPLARRYVHGLVEAVGIVLLLRSIGDFRYVGAFKRVRGTRFARYDTRFYSPLTLALAVAMFLIAW